jgi:hypothetical protein
MAIFPKLESSVLKLIRYEKWLFVSLIAVHLIPLFALPFFPTLDGPAHLYNANLINHFLFGDHSFLEQYFYLNTEPEPNWIGHAILCWMNGMFPVNVAEKVIQAFYIIMLPISFRYVVKSVNPHAVFVEYIIFPFIYSFTFYLGFYNFSIGIPAVFFTLGYFVRHQNNFNAVKFLFLFLLLLAVYFSHLFLFILIGLLIALFIMWNFIYDSVREKKIFWFSFLKKSGLVLLAALPGILLTLNFISKKATSAPGDYLAADELVKWIKQVRPVVALSFEEEERYTAKLFYLLFFLTIGTLAVKFLRLRFSSEEKHVEITHDKTRLMINRNDVWALSSIILLFLLFYLPDTFANAGYISVRCCLFFFFVWILWLASQKINRYAGIFVLVVSCWVSYNLMKYHLKVSKNLSNDAVEITSVTPHIQPNNTLLPLNFSDNWLQSHLSNYLGAEKKIVIFENYEAANKYFPVRWQDKTEPYTSIGGFRNRLPCFQLLKYEQDTPGKINYILTWKMPENITDSCAIKTVRTIDSLYTKVFSSPNGDAVLYQRK